MQRVPALKSLLALSLAAMVVAAGCGGGETAAPPVGTVDVSLASDHAPIGSPLQMTYRFTLAADAPALGQRRVFVHFLDQNDEFMWGDDHDPPTPTTDWRPGQTVEYTRTVFLPVYPYTGETRVVVGLYTPGTTGADDRVVFGNPGRGNRSYQVATFDLQPQTENLFVIFKDGWHPAEIAGEGAGQEWQWTRKEATLSFRNPGRDVMLFLQADNPSAGPETASQVEVRIGDTLIETVPVSAGEAPIQRIPITAAQLGTAETAEIRLVADRTFVPALQPGSSSNDTRELGVRVFHAFVQPQ
ncbi:MAG: hypothetical protein AB7O67_18935 [Vicinamibacterales bacterium]